MLQHTRAKKRGFGFSLVTLLKIDSFVIIIFYYYLLRLHIEGPVICLSIFLFVLVGVFVIIVIFVRFYRGLLVPYSLMHRLSSIQVSLWDLVLVIRYIIYSFSGLSLLWLLLLYSRVSNKPFSCGMACIRFETVVCLEGKSIFFLLSTLFATQVSSLTFYLLSMSFHHIEREGI